MYAFKPRLLAMSSEMIALKLEACCDGVVRSSSHIASLTS